MTSARARRSTNGRDARRVREGERARFDLVADVAEDDPPAVVQDDLADEHGVRERCPGRQVDRSGETRQVVAHLERRRRDDADVERRPLLPGLPRGQGAGRTAAPSRSESVTSTSLEYVPRSSVTSPRSWLPDVVAGRDQIRVDGQPQRRNGAHRDAASLEREAEVLQRAAGRAGSCPRQRPLRRPPWLAGLRSRRPSRPGARRPRCPRRRSPPCRYRPFSMRDRSRSRPGFVSGPAAARSTEAGRPGRGPARRGPGCDASALPVTFASTAGLSAARSSAPRSRRSIPSPHGVNVAEHEPCRSRATGGTSPSVRSSPGRPRPSRRASRDDERRRTALSLPRAGGAHGPCAASGARRRRVAAHAGVKSRRAARSRTSSPTSSTAGVAERSPRAETPHRSATEPTPRPAPCVTRTARCGSSAAGIALP